MTHTAADTTEAPSGSTVGWNDPSLPAGQAPPQPRWRLVLSVAVFVLWLAFLVVMVVLRMRTAAF